MPRVSVIIPLYNAAATIARAIDSVLAQTFTDYEIVCVDDGSTDDSGAMLAKYGERVRVVPQQNRGTSAARNLGVRASGGEYLAFLDADDIWRADKLERTVAALDENPECVLAYSDLTSFDQGGGEARPMIDAATARAPSLDDLLTRMWPIFPSTAVMRREAFERAGRFCEELSAFEDVQFFLRLREAGPFRYIPEPLVRYAHPDTAKMVGKAIRKNPGSRYFARLVRRRYGRRADGLLNYFARYKVNLLSYAGLLALGRGDRRGARRCFRMALGWNPRRMKTYLRLARTFLPRRMAAALSASAARRRAARDEA